MNVRIISVAVVAMVTAVTASAGPLKFAIKADRADCLYKCGEVATFEVVALETNGLPAKAGTVVKATLDDFGTNYVVKSEWCIGATNVWKVSGALAKPGFLKLRLQSEGSQEALWGVAYEPEKIRKSSTTPKDFDKYWASEKKRLAREVPPDFKMVKIPERSKPEFDFYQLSCASFGRRIWGYISIPTDKSKAPYPVRFGVSAAGVGAWAYKGPAGDKDAIVVYFTAYPYEPDWKWTEAQSRERNKQLEKELSEKYGRGSYAQQGIAVSREDFFFHPLILGVDRAIDWVMTRKDVDRRNVSYHGSSQGGGMGLVLAGLNHNFTKVTVHVPALTDILSGLSGRRCGWPQLMELHRGNATNLAAVVRNAAYFDSANFASRIRCPVGFTVGFVDMTCPPPCVYATYNEIKTEKTIFHDIGYGHNVSPKGYAFFSHWKPSKK